MIEGYDTLSPLHVVHAFSSPNRDVKIEEGLVHITSQQLFLSASLEQSDITTEMSGGQAEICRFARLVAEESSTLLSL